MKIRIPLGKNEFQVSFERTRTKPAPKTTVDNLSYELQLLLGATAVIQVIEDWDAKQTSDSTKFGNIVNYYKDSAYLHIRNLLNALTNQYSVDGQTVPPIQAGLYGQWKSRIEKFALHNNTDRNQDSVSNMIGGVHLNGMIPRLTGEVVRCWKEWASQTTDIKLERNLKAILADKQHAAATDAIRLRTMIEGKK